MLSERCAKTRPSFLWTYGKNFTIGPFHMKVLGLHVKLFNSKLIEQPVKGEPKTKVRILVPMKVSLLPALHANHSVMDGSNAFLGKLSRERRYDRPYLSLKVGFDPPLKGCEISPEF